MGPRRSSRRQSQSPGQKARRRGSVSASPPQEPAPSTTLRRSIIAGKAPVPLSQELFGGRPRSRKVSVVDRRGSEAAAGERRQSLFGVQKTAATISRLARRRRSRTADAVEGFGEHVEADDDFDLTDATQHLHDTNMLRPITRRRSNRALPVIGGDGVPGDGRQGAQQGSLGGQVFAAVREKVIEKTEDEPQMRRLSLSLAPRRPTVKAGVQATPRPSTGSGFFTPTPPRRTESRRGSTVTRRVSSTFGPNVVHQLHMMQKPEAKILLQLVAADEVFLKDLRQVFTAAIGGSVAERISLARFRTFARDANISLDGRPVAKVESDGFFTPKGSRSVDRVSLDMLFGRLAKPEAAMNFDRFVYALLHVADLFYPELFLESAVASLRRLYEHLLQPYAAMILKPEDDPANRWSVSDVSIDRYLFQHEEVIRRIFRKFTSQDLRDEPSVGGVGIGHPKYMEVGAHWRELMRHEDFVRFAKWAKFYPQHLTAFQVAKILKASNTMFPDHPLKKGCDDVALVEPEFRDALVRVAQSVFGGAQWKSTGHFPEGEAGRLERLDGFITTYIQEEYQKLTGFSMMDDVDVEPPRLPVVAKVAPRWCPETGGVDTVASGQDFCMKRGVYMLVGAEVAHCHTREPTRAVFRVPSLDQKRYPLNTFVVECFEKSDGSSATLAVRKTRSVPVRFSNDRRAFAKPHPPFDYFTYERRLGSVSIPQGLYERLRLIHQRYAREGSLQQQYMSRNRWKFFCRAFGIGEPSASPPLQPTTTWLSEGVSSESAPASSTEPPIEWSARSLTLEQSMLLSPQPPVADTAQELFSRMSQIRHVRQACGKSTQAPVLSLSDFATALAHYVLSERCDMSGVVESIGEVLDAGSALVEREVSTVQEPELAPDPREELLQEVISLSQQRQRGVFVMRGPVVVCGLKEIHTHRDRAAARDATMAPAEGGQLIKVCDAPSHLVKRVELCVDIAVGYDAVLQRLLANGFLLAPATPAQLGEWQPAVFQSGSSVRLRATNRHTDRYGALSDGGVGSVVGPADTDDHLKVVSGQRTSVYDRRVLVSAEVSSFSTFRRCWVIRRSGRLLGAMWSIPGHLSTLNWLPSDLELRHPCISAMLHCCTTVDDTDFLQFVVAFRQAADAANLQALLISCGFTFSQQTAGEQGSDFRGKGFRKC